MIRNLWNCINARYKQNIHCYRILLNEDKSNQFDKQLVIEYDHNLFLTECCKIYNGLVDRYTKIYDYHPNQEIFNCNVCLTLV